MLTMQGLKDNSDSVRATDSSVSGDPGCKLVVQGDGNMCLQFAVDVD